MENIFFTSLSSKGDDEFEFANSACKTGTCIVKNTIETKRNELKENETETELNESKEIETKTFHFFIS